MVIPARTEVSFFISSRQDIQGPCMTFLLSYYIHTRYFTRGQSGLMEIYRSFKSIAFRKDGTE